MLTIDELEEIFKEDNDIDWKGDNALIGLNIISKYFPNKTVLQGADHDIIYSVDIYEIVEAKLTTVDAIKLRNLNWMIQDDMLCCYV